MNHSSICHGDRQFYTPASERSDSANPSVEPGSILTAKGVGVSPETFRWAEEDFPDGRRPLLLGKAFQYVTSIPVDDAGLIKQLYETIRYKESIEFASGKFGLQTAIICGMGSAVSCWGLMLQPVGAAGQGNAGVGRGLMQIDARTHEFASSGPWDIPKENVCYACELLANALMALKQSTSLRGRTLLRAALIATESGMEAALARAKQGLKADYLCKERDYSSDVMNRAGWFQLHGWL